MQHELKTWPVYFQAVVNGTKTFEMRKDDRNFRVDDTLLLKEFNPSAQFYTGQEMLVKITYKLDGFAGVTPGYCVLGIVPMRAFKVGDAVRATANDLPIKQGDVGIVVHVDALESIGVEWERTTGEAGEMHDCDGYCKRNHGWYMSPFDLEINPHTVGPAANSNTEEVLPLKQMKAMKLHEVVTVNSSFAVTRVDGGWLYSLGTSLAFVPEQQVNHEATNYGGGIGGGR
jgi:hypothetical protein